MDIAVERWNQEQQDRPQKFRLECLDRAIKLYADSTDDENVVLRAADAFYKFVTEGVVPSE